MRPLLAPCLVAAFLAGPVSLHGQEPEPVVPVPPTPPPVSVNVTGPSQVASGDFVVVAIGSVSEGAESTWGYDPDPGPEHRAVFVEPATGRQLVVFIQAPAGVYHLTLVGQMVTEGKDPTDAATKMVTVGKPKPPGPPPDPDNPDPPPGPDLKGLAKIAYDAAVKVGRPDEAEAVSGAYLGAASYGAAVSNSTVDEIRAKLSSEIKAAIPDDAARKAWSPFGAAMEAEIKKAGTKAKLIEALEEIANGAGEVR